MKFLKLLHPVVGLPLSLVTFASHAATYVRLLEDPLISFRCCYILLHFTSRCYYILLNLESGLCYILLHAFGVSAMREVAVAENLQKLPLSLVSFASHSASYVKLSADPHR